MNKMMCSIGLFYVVTAQEAGPSSRNLDRNQNFLRRANNDGDIESNESPTASPTASPTSAPTSGCNDDLQVCEDYNGSVGRDPYNGCAFFDCSTLLNDEGGTTTPATTTRTQPVIVCATDSQECPNGSFVQRDAENGCDFPECPEAVFCTSDVFECPNGSFVRRDTENKCEFFPCPEEAPAPLSSNDTALEKEAWIGGTVVVTVIVIVAVITLIYLGRKNQWSWFGREQEEEINAKQVEKTNSDELSKQQGSSETANQEMASSYTPGMQPTTASILQDQQQAGTVATAVLMANGNSSNSTGGRRAGIEVHYA